MKKPERFIEKREEIHVEAVLFCIGQDRLICVSGGDVPHIGAVSFGNREEAYHDAARGHKELLVTEKMFCTLRECVEGNLLVTGGIHLENITAVQIDAVLAVCEELTEKIRKRL